jgi:hypothetical protein
MPVLEVSKTARITTAVSRSHLKVAVFIECTGLPSERALLYEDTEAIGRIKDDSQGVGPVRLPGGSFYHDGVNSTSHSWALAVLQLYKTDDELLQPMFIPPRFTLLKRHSTLLNHHAYRSPLQQHLRRDIHSRR